MSSPFRLSLLTMGLLLAGCSGTYNGGLESVHQPVVTRNDYSFDVATAGGTLAPGEAARLAGWMASLRLGYGDHVAVEGSADTVAREQIAAEARRYGLMLADDAPVTPGEIQPGSLRVVVTRMTASVPHCPDFSRQVQPDYSASASSDFGCATNSNLAAMVANPGDLVRGQPGSETSDPATATKAIRTLRDATPTGAGGLKSESTGGGSGGGGGGR